MLSYIQSCVYEGKNSYSYLTPQTVVKINALSVKGLHSDCDALLDLLCHRVSCYVSSDIASIKPTVI